MSGYRFRFDLFIQFDPTTKDIDPELKKDILKIRDECIKLKSFSKKIVPTDPTGNRPEEDTTKAVFHICYHDENPTLPCDPEQDISLLTDEKPKVKVAK